MPVRVIPLVVSVVMMAGSCCAAAVMYWTPAHELAPEGVLVYPAAGDIDGDSDCDLSYHIGHDQYWNVGTPQSPEWELDTTMFGDLPGPEPVGADGDVDSDGDLDALVAAGLFISDALGRPPASRIGAIAERERAATT